jgi:hypothetical protein
MIWFTFLASIIGVGYAALVVLGVSPDRLLVFDGFSANYKHTINFERNPVNLFWLVAGGATILSALVAIACGRAVGAARRRAAQAEEVFARLTALRFDDEEAWQDPALHEDSELDTFLTETLGAHRLLKAKLTRYIGQDGELHRLEKALVDNSRNDLNSNYENPAVARLADEVSRLFDARLEAEQARIDLSERMRSGGAELSKIIEQACQWNSAILDQINLQSAGLERVAVKVRKIGETAQQHTGAGGSVPAELVEEVRSLAAGLPAPSGPAKRGQSGLAELVDRGSKLAFQIAMEVARLGPRGERLLPMTQELEELTTEFRNFSAGPEGDAGGPNQVNAALRELAGKLENLPTTDEGAGGEAAAGTIAESVREVVSLTRQIGERLLELARGFNQQTERLQQAGQCSARVTGVPFEYTAPSGSTQTEEPGPIGVDRFDPFGRGEDRRPTEVPDPFASAPDSVMDGEPAAGGSGLDPLVTPGLESAPRDVPGAGSLNDAPDPGDRLVGDGSSPLDGSTSPFAPADVDPFATDDDADDGTSVRDDDGGVQQDARTVADPFGDASAPSRPTAPGSLPGGAADLDLPTTTGSDALSSEPDRVYDLSEFGAVAISSPGSAERGVAPGETPDRTAPAPAAAEGDERVYDLSEFGAEVVV